MLKQPTESFFFFFPDMANATLQLINYFVCYGLQKRKRHSKLKDIQDITTSLHKRDIDFLWLIPLLSPIFLHYDTNIVSHTVGSLRHLGCSKRWISSNCLVTSAKWQTTLSSACNLVENLHIHIDSALMLSYHSVVADTKLYYWSQPINKDKGAQF